MATRTISRMVRPASASTALAVIPCQCPKALTARGAFQTQSQSRQYSTPPPPPPPKTYFQPGDPHGPSPNPSDLRSQLASQSPQIPNPYEEPPPPPKRTISIRGYIYAVIFFTLGSVVGKSLTVIISPPMIEPGSEIDGKTIASIKKEAEELPIVQSLSNDPNWTYHEAYDGVAAEDKTRRFTGGPLGGARGLGGFQRVFCNKETGELVAVVHFGRGLGGIPGMTHGGVLATVLDEVLGRCALRRFPQKTGVTANLDINYLKPTLGGFHVIRAVPVAEGFTDRKGWVSGRIERMNGQVTVEAKGLFVVPKQFSLKAIQENF
ncbi:HotDog domain-containing protein [Amylocarpus encephaloides]|uniref:HotDog domain-containing protein n=1 Tax=Amylocarpus encephaloides TaxID=45428 RepID=A0A9P7YEU4_9HELO|nr:HotDog domain-containing protein [Amylocarpus encephaloides]